MKKIILIVCGVAVVIVAGLVYKNLYLRDSEPVTSATPLASYGFVGSIVSMKSNILIVRGLPDGGVSKVSKDVTVTMTPNTKIFRKDPPSVTAYAKTPSTMDELYEAVQKGQVLIRITADYDFYGTDKATPQEVIYMTSVNAGSL